MRPTRKDLQYFLVVCDYLNFSHAAEKLNLQQAAISKTIKKLEDECANKLFLRKGKGLNLTEFGQLLQQQLITVEDIWDKNFYKKLEQHESLSGRIKIGTHATLAIHSFGKTLVKLMELSPDLFVDLSLLPSPLVAKKVINGDLDLGLVINPPKHPDLIIKSIQKEYIALWSKSSTPTSIIYYNPDMINSLQFLKKFKHLKRVSISSYELLAELSQHSLGHFLLPSPIAAKRKHLKQVGKKLANVSLSLVYRYDRPKTKAFQSILDTIC